jgi:hypothetical protein
MFRVCAKRFLAAARENDDSRNDPGLEGAEPKSYLPRGEKSSPAAEETLSLPMMTAMWLLPRRVPTNCSALRVAVF